MKVYPLLLRSKEDGGNIGRRGEMLGSINPGGSKKRHDVIGFEATGKKLINEAGDES